MKNKNIKIKVLLLFCFIFRATTFGEWMLVDDYEGSTEILNTSMYDEYFNFSVENIAFEIAVDPNLHDNKVLKILSRKASFNITSMLAISLPNFIPDEGIASLYFRLRKEQDQDFIYQSLSMGLSDTPLEVVYNTESSHQLLTNPSSFDDFEVQMYSYSDGDQKFKVRDNNSILEIEQDPIYSDWIEIWIHIDQENDTFQIYMRSKKNSEITNLSAPNKEENDQLVDRFSFRNGTMNPLVTFLVIMVSTNPSPGETNYIDDIYLYPDRFMLSSPVMWGDWFRERDNTFYVDTGDFLGWLYIQGSFVYSYSLGKYIYLPENNITKTGSWCYFYK